MKCTKITIQVHGSACYFDDLLTVQFLSSVSTAMFKLYIYKNVKSLNTEVAGTWAGCSLPNSNLVLVTTKTPFSRAFIL